MKISINIWENFLVPEPFNGSIVTTAYLEIYEKCNFQIEPRQFSKNFVTIYMKKGD